MGRFRVQVSMGFCRPRKLTLLGWLIMSGYGQNNFRPSNFRLLRSNLSLGAGRGSFIDGRRVVDILHLPQIE